MDAKKMYMSNVKDLLFYSGTKEKEYLEDIENRVYEFDEVTYEELVEQLGSPAEVI